MKTALLCLTLLACGAAPAARAQTDPAAPAWGVGFDTERQRLNNGSPDWTENTLRLNRNLGPHHLFELDLGDVHRFGLQDDQTSATYVQPLNERLGLTLDGNVSSTHRFLPQYGAGLTLQYEFARAWLLHGGLRNTRYTDTSIDQGLLMLEHYVSAFSWAAVWRPVRALGSSTSGSELRGSYYYGDRNVVTLSYAGGQEATQLGGGVIVLADVRSVVFSGRHWLSRDWALNYVLNSTQQGDFYTRNGLRIGVQYLF